MTTYLINASLAVLTFIFMRRTLAEWLREQRLWLKIAVPLLILGVTAVDIFFLTYFETIFCVGMILILYLFRKDIFGFLKRISEKKLGKLLVTFCVMFGFFGMWLGLAVFYKTDIGKYIGVKNYLYHKYNEEFDVNGFMGAKIKGSSTNKLTCCPKNGNPATDSFNVERKKNLSIGSRRFASDNYYGVIIREDYEKYVSTFIDDYFEDFTVNVNFNFSGLSNSKYMSDEFDRDTSLEEFLAFQRDENNYRACNFAQLDIVLNFQPTVTDQEWLTNQVSDLFDYLATEYNYLRIYVMGSEDNYNVITGLLSPEFEVNGFRISDDFFKKVEEK